MLHPGAQLQRRKSLSGRSLPSFPSPPKVLDPEHARGALEAYIEHLITLLDALDAPGEDLEPEPDEALDDDEATDLEESWVPVSLNTDFLPPRQLRSLRSGNKKLPIRATPSTSALPLVRTPVGSAGPS